MAWKLFSEGTKKHSFMGNTAGEASLSGVMVIVLAVAMGAILTGAIGPTSLAQMVNATLASGVLNLAPSQVINTFNTIPIAYSIAFLVIPVAAVIKYMDN